MSEEMTNIFNIITMTICILAFIFNIIGLYLVKSSRLGNSIQIKIIMNLSCCDIFISTTTIVVMVLHFSGHPLVRSRAAQVIWAHRTAVYHTWFGMFYLLTVDRFLGCNFPFRYRTLTSPKKCKIILGVSWVIPIILAPIFSVLDTMKVRVYFNKYLWVVYDGIFLLLFMVTYSTVFYRKQKSTQKIRRRSTKGPGNQRFFALTAAMLTAFMFLETIPVIVSACITMVSIETRDVFQHVFELCWNSNLLVDPFIYIYLMPRVRRTAFNKLRILCGQRSKDREAAMTRSTTMQNTFSAAFHVTKDERD